MVLFGSLPLGSGTTTIEEDQDRKHGATSLLIDRRDLHRSVQSQSAAPTAGASGRRHRRAEQTSRYRVPAESFKDSWPVEAQYQGGGKRSVAATPEAWSRRRISPLDLVRPSGCAQNRTVASPTVRVHSTSATIKTTIMEGFSGPRRRERSYS